MAQDPFKQAAAQQAAREVTVIPPDSAAAPTDKEVAAIVAEESKPATAAPKAGEVYYTGRGSFIFSNGDRAFVVDGRYHPETPEQVEELEAAAKVGNIQRIGG